MGNVTDRLLQQVSQNVRNYFHQYKYIKQHENFWSKSKAHSEHEMRRKLHERLDSVERAQAWLIIVADETTCPTSLLP